MHRRIPGALPQQSRAVALPRRVRLHGVVGSCTATDGDRCHQHRAVRRACPGRPRMEAARGRAGHRDFAPLWGQSPSCLRRTGSAATCLRPHCRGGGQTGIRGDVWEGMGGRSPPLAVLRAVGHTPWRSRYGTGLCRDHAAVAACGQRSRSGAPRGWVGDEGGTRPPTRGLLGGETSIPSLCVLRGRGVAGGARREEAGGHKPFLPGSLSRDHLGLPGARRRMGCGDVVRCLCPLLRSHGRWAGQVGRWHRGGHGKEECSSPRAGQPGPL